MISGKNVHIRVDKVSWVQISSGQAVFAKFRVDFESVPFFDAFVMNFPASDSGVSEPAECL